MLGAPVTVESLSTLIEGAALLKWAPAVAFALIVDLAARRSGSPFVLPIAIATFLALFHAGVWLFDLSLTDLQRAGWLFAPPQDGSIRLPFQGNPLALADWSMIWSELPKISALLDRLDERRSFAANPIWWWDPDVTGYSPSGEPLYDE